MSDFKYLIMLGKDADTEKRICTPHQDRVYNRGDATTPVYIDGLMRSKLGRPAAPYSTKCIHRRQFE